MCIRDSRRVETVLGLAERQLDDWGVRPLEWGGIHWAHPVSVLVGLRMGIEVHPQDGNAVQVRPSANTLDRLLLDALQAPPALPNVQVVAGGVEVEDRTRESMKANLVE